jgi:nitrite reductase (cytochrome c-552)
MNLRISRPTLLEAFEAMGRDIEEVSHQEMRSLVCAQCHVEYYFNKEIAEGVDYLVFPWKNGTTIEGHGKVSTMNWVFPDWNTRHYEPGTHTCLKDSAHPDYEIYLNSCHCQRVCPVPIAICLFSVRGDRNLRDLTYRALE